MEEVRHVTPEMEVICNAITEAEVICPEGCNRKFKSRFSLNMHVRQVHYKNRHESEKCKILYHCPIQKCIYNESFKENGKHFANLKFLRQHYFKVHADQKFQCSNCDKKYSTTSLLAVHERVCGINLICNCGYTAVSLEVLQSHVRRKKHEISPSTIAALKERKMKNAHVSSLYGKSSQAKLPLHLIAAIALSEMASTSTLKSVPSAEIGTQTDDTGRRFRKQSVSGSDGCKISQKRRHSAETQTSLTNLQTKRKKLLTPRSIAKSRLNNSSQTHENTTVITGAKESVKKNLMFIASMNAASESNANTLRSDIISQQISNFKQSDSSIKVSMSVSSSQASTLNNDLIFNSDKNEQYLEVDDDMLDELRDSSLINLSFTTENDNKHDALLSMNAYTNGLTHTETQTDFYGDVDIPEMLSPHNPSHANLCCSSETQTCEDFCDIEQYLYSNIHTQTSDETDSDLFPELTFSSLD